MRIDVTVVGPDGTARDIAVLAPRGTPWGQVRELCGAGALWCGDGPLSDAELLGGDRLRDGALLHRAPPVSAAAPAGHRLDVVGGPDAGRGLPLGREPVTLGRAPECTLVLHDPRVSRVHARVSLGVRGATVRDCGSAGGTFVEALPAGDAPALVPAGAYLRLGDTFVCLSGPGPAEPGPGRGAGDAGEIALPTPPDRSSAARVQWAAAALPAVLGIGLALAVHSAQFLLFALLSPLALLGSAAADRLHRGRELRRSGRHYRRRLAEVHERVERRLAREIADRRAADPDPPALLRGLRQSGPFPVRHSMSIRLGLADQPSRLLVRDADGTRPAGTARTVPHCVDLARGPLGIAAPPAVARGVARWAVAQLVARASPDTVGIRALLTTDTASDWRWLRWLPHLDAPPATAAAEHAEQLAELAAQAELRTVAPRDGQWAGRWTVLLVDGPDPGDMPGLADLLAGERPGFTAVCVGSSRGRLPAGCRAVATAVGDTGSTLQVRTPDDEVRLVADRVDLDWCDRLARRLAAWHSGRGRAGTLPSSCSLLELLGLTAPTTERIARRWRDGGGTLDTVLGAAADGPVRLDLVRDGPHALVAGTTGSGKSELLRTLVAGLAANHPPDEVGFVLIDYKGGAAFAECAEFAHTLGVVTDLDGHLAARALASLECELRRRERLFAAAGARDFPAYRARPGAGAGAGAEGLARLVIVVDEFAELAAELPGFVDGLVGIARRGRSLGVHLVLATQRPAGVVSAEIRANAAVRIALRVTDGGDSQDVIDRPDAAAIDPRRPGRACLLLPGSSPVLLQTALVSGAAPTSHPAAVQVLELDRWRRPIARAATGQPATELQQLVAAVRAAAPQRGRTATLRPWLPPLPEAIALGALAGAGGEASERTGTVSIGLLDLPHEQRQVPFTVDLAAGGTLLFAGGPGSGRTDALRTLAVAAATRLAPARLHLHVIDHAGGGLADLAALPHCGSLAIGDPAVSSRLLTRLTAEVARRRAPGATEDAAALLVVLDGWEQFLAAAEQHADTGLVEALTALLRDGPSVGVTVALTGDRAALAPRVCSAVATRLALRLTDRADYALLGLRERSVPARLPPGRAIRAADGAELQVAHLGEAATRAAARGAIARAAARWTGSGPGRELIRVRALPEIVHLRDLERQATAVAGSFGASTATAPVLLGVGGDAAEPLVADLFAGRSRLLVAGRPGSGRSTLLLSVFDQLAEQGVAVVVAAAGLSPLSRRARAAGLAVIGPDEALPAAPEGPAVLLLDDAERFTDRPAGDALLEWAQRDPALAVVAAGSSDELALSFRGIAAHVRSARCAVLLDPGPGGGELVGVRLTGFRGGGPPGRGVVIGDRAWGPPFGAAPVPLQVAIQVAQP